MAEKVSINSDEVKQGWMTELVSVHFLFVLL